MHGVVSKVLSVEAAQPEERLEAGSRQPRLAGRQSKSTKKRVQIAGVRHHGEVVREIVRGEVMREVVREVVRGWL
jgi:hypothetical protein